MKRKKIIIIGGGPAGLMAADQLSLKYDVCLYDKEKNIGQKFLVAGKGGFNLTNHLQGEALTKMYTPKGFLNKALLDFDSVAFRQWLSDLGVPTFVGTSGRVFPEKDIQPVDVLNKIKAKLQVQGVKLFPEHKFVTFDNQKQIVFTHNEKEIVDKADFVLFALGGASWHQTGSDGLWQTIFKAQGIDVNPFQPSNCGVNISWPDSVKSHEGKPLKNIRLFAGDMEIKGEAVITEYGLEGNAVYPLVPDIRKMIDEKKSVKISVDFKPSNSEEQLLEKLKGIEVKTKDYAKILNLSSASLAMIKAYTSKEDFLSVPSFIKSIKKLIIPVDSLRPVDEAISTIGGIPPSELNEDFSLKKFSWIYTLGEMVDWDAPTGGFLIQACFSMGHCTAGAILAKD